MLALIGAGYTLQKFKKTHPSYNFYETHRENLLATEFEVKGDLSFIEKADGLVFSLPPSPAALNLVRHLSFERKAILLSSIGVYAKDQAIVNENGNLGCSERSKLIWEIEQEFLKLPGAVILRLGGLFDETRHPVNYIVRNNSRPQAQELVNFVHCADVVAAIHTLLKEKPKHQIYNLVDKNHPTKEQYYSALTDQSINFSRQSNHQCQIDSSRFIMEFSMDENFLNRVR